MSITGGTMWVILITVMPVMPQYAVKSGNHDDQSRSDIVTSSNNNVAGIDYVNAFMGKDTDEDVVQVASDSHMDVAGVTAPVMLDGRLDIFSVVASATSDGDENIVRCPAVVAEILTTQASSVSNIDTFMDTATNIVADTDAVREFTDANMPAEQDYDDGAENVLKRDRRTLTYVDPSTLLLIFGLGTPLQLDSESVIVGVFTKMIYTLPTNSTDFTEPGVYFGRTKSRWSIYKVLERAAELYGFEAGKGCLLRAICEVASTPFDLHHGLFGQMAQAVLSPSSTSEAYDEYRDREYHAAERLGRHVGQNCHALYPECKRNVLDIFSTTASTTTTTATTTKPSLI